jgi:hypothetical protein
MNKPKCKLIDEDGNVFNIIGRVMFTLEKNNLRDQAKEFKRRAWECPSYSAVLRLVSEYVEIV